MEVVPSDRSVPSVAPSDEPTLSNSRNSIVETGTRDTDNVQQSFFTVEKFHLQDAVFVALLALTIVFIVMFWARKTPECTIIHAEILYDDNA